MRAGLFKEYIHMLERGGEQTASGYVDHGPRVLYVCRCRVRKQLQSYDKGGVQAGELYWGETLTLDIRADKRAERCYWLDYRGVRYDIVGTHHSIDQRTISLVCRKTDFDPPSGGR